MSSSSSSSFPFLQLPFVVQLLILNKLSLYEFFNFSLISPQTKQLAKHRKVRFSNLSWTVNDESRDFQLELRNFFVPFEVFAFRISSRGAIKEPPEYCRINGKRVVMTTSHHGSNSLWKMGDNQVSSKEGLELLEELSEHVLDIIHAEQFELDWDRWVSLELADCSLLKHTKTFRRLTVRGWNYSGTKPIKARNVEMILKEFQIEKFELLCQVEEGFKFSGTLSMEKIRMDDSRWLTSDALLNMKCREMDISTRNNLISDEDLNCLVKRWFAGGLENLERLHIHMWPDGSQERLDIILKGVQTFPFDKGNRKRFIERLDLETGRDMRRRDGKLATAFMNMNISFYFFVWK